MSSFAPEQTSLGPFIDQETVNRERILHKRLPDHTKITRVDGVSKWKDYKIELTAADSNQSRKVQILAALRAGSFKGKKFVASQADNYVIIRFQE